MGQSNGVTLNDQRGRVVFTYAGLDPLAAHRAVLTRTLEKIDLSSEEIDRKSRGREIVHEIYCWIPARTGNGARRAYHDDSSRTWHGPERGKDVVVEWVSPVICCNGRTMVDEASPEDRKNRDEDYCTDGDDREKKCLPFFLETFTHRSKSLNFRWRSC